MSLFASLGSGDIWALSGIVFPNSPLSDLLDGNNFTLEDLLREDELIQEVKVKNDRLLDFLSRDDSIEQLIKYVIRPATETDSDDRKFKYPYMSCEVICCEVPEVLHMLVHGGDGKYLRLLFSFLEQQGELDCYLAGYFEKILEMLFRRMTTQMMQFFNAQGLPLLKAFLSHVQNYSIMQIVQRLMLPHLPFCMPSDGDGLSFDEPKENDKCRWSLLPETCELLLTAMLQATQVDVPLHVSDMLITVLQLSPPETLLVTFLCQKDSVKALLDCATNDQHSALLGQSLMALEGLSAEEESEREKALVKANVSLAATSVLESLVSRLYESCFPMSNGGPDASDASALLEQQAVLAAVQEQIAVICAEIVPFVPLLTDVLRRILDQKHTHAMRFQCKALVPRLGHHGLQLIKLVESLTRIDSAALDKAFCEHGLFEVCLDLFLTFEYNSVLHLSVQRIFVSIFEGTKRSETQAHICSKSRLLQVLMDRLGCEDLDSARNHGGNALTYFRADESASTFSTRHSSLVGNLILIAHATFLLLDSSEREDTSSVEGGTPAKLEGEKSLGEARGISIDVSDDLDRSASASAMEAKADKESQERALALRERLGDVDALTKWDVFTFSKLKAILDHQMVGSYEVPAPELSLNQQEDHFKAALAAEMDPFEFEDDGDDQGRLDDDDFAPGGDNIDFGSTLRVQDEFWSSASGFEDEFDVDSDGDSPSKLSHPEHSSSPVIEEFADFSSFEAPSPDEAPEPSSPPERVEDVEFDTVKFDDNDSF